MKMPIVLIRGGGDLATGVAARLQRVGIAVVVTELAQPLVVRRLAAFAEAVYSGEATVEGIMARRVADMSEMELTLAKNQIPVLIDPELNCLSAIQPIALVDARLTKRPPELGREAAALVVGLGPGFTAGQDCHAVVETLRGHTLGRVIWQGQAARDTGAPEARQGKQTERVLRAPIDGQLITRIEIGERVKEGDVIAEVGGELILAPFEGLLRGLLYSGLAVKAGMKIGDIDPRNDPALCRTISDKALAIGGGVLEALLTKPDVRASLWGMNAAD